MTSKKQLNVYNLAPTPSDRNHVKSKCDFKEKENELRNVNKFKIRLALKGYKQTQGVNYNLQRTPVSRIFTLTMILSLAVKIKLKVHERVISKVSSIP